MSEHDHHAALERLYLGAPINRFYGAEIEVAGGSARITNPLRDDFWHAAHATHGSVIFKLLDDAAFFAASSLVTDVFMLTVSFNVQFTRPVATGRLVADGRVVHRSRRLFLADASVTDDDGREVGRGSGSFMRSRIELGPEVGYR